MRGTDRPDLGKGGPLELLDRYPVTFGVLAANLALYTFAASRSGSWRAVDREVSYRLGANLWPVSVAEPWRLLTSAFLHHDFLHLLFNALAIFSVARLLEVHLGSARVWCCYVLSALGGSALSLAWQGLRGPTLSVGASGAAFGLILCGLVYSSRAPERLGSVAQQLTNWVVGIVAFSLLFFQALDHAAHIGGAAVGALFGWRFDARPSADPHPVWRGLTHLLALLCLASFAAVVLRMRAGS